MRTTKKSRLLLAVATLSASAACLPGAPIANATAAAMWGGEPGQVTVEGSSALPITNAALRGDIGDVAGLDGRSRLVNSWADPEFPFTTIDVTVVKEDGTAGMAILNLSGLYADLERAPSGVYRASATENDVIIDENGDSYTQIDGDEAELPMNDTDRVDVTLCAGEAAYSWDYDAPAEDVVVEIEEPVVYEADPEACPECEPMTTRRVTFVTRAHVVDDVGDMSPRVVSGTFTMLLSPSAAVE